MADVYRSQLWYQEVSDMTFGCMACALSKYWCVVAVCQCCGFGVVWFHYETPVCRIRLFKVSGATRNGVWTLVTLSNAATPGSVWSLVILVDIGLLNV